MGLVAKQRNTFDPRGARGNRYDPAGGNHVNGGSNAGTATMQAAQGQKMQVNITIANLTAVALTAELWNWLTSSVRIQNLAFQNGHYLYIPLLTYEGIAAVAAAAHDGTTGFNAAGNLEVRGDTLAGDLKMTIGCQEVAYSSFFESSGTNAFQVSSMRVNFRTDAQISNIIFWTQRTFAGLTSANPFAPRSYQTPTQFNPLLIDLPVQFTVGVDSGLKFLVNAAETLTLSIWINMWTVQSIGHA